MTQILEKSDTLTMVNTRKIRQIVRLFLDESGEQNAATNEWTCRHCRQPLAKGHDEECPVAYAGRVMEGTE